MDEKREAAARLPVPVLVAAFAAMVVLFHVPAGSAVSAVCAFLAPTLYLYAFHRCSTRRQWIITWLVFAAGLTMMNLFYSPSVFLDIAIFFLSAAYISIAFMLDSHFRGDGSRFRTTLIFPAAWVSLFHISTAIKMGFQFRFNSFATAMRALIQVESIIGSAGVLFLIIWTASVIVYIVENKKAASKAGIAAWALVMAGCAIFGAVRLQSGETDVPTVKAAYSTGPFVGDFINYQELDLESYTASIEKTVADAADKGAEVILFPEETIFIPEEREAEFISFVSSLAKKHSINIICGEEVCFNLGTDDEMRDNRLSWYSPEGSCLFRYTKHSLVPIVETGTYIKGTGELPALEIPFKAGSEKVSAAICYDCDFSGYIASNPADTQLLFAPSWDWAHVSDYHGEAAREIAIENGVTMLKVTYDGISYLFSPLGETLSSSSTGEEGFEKVHLVDMPIEGRVTLFARYGQYYGQVFACLTAVIMILLEIKKRKTERGNKV